MNFVRALLTVTVMLFGAVSANAQAVPGQGTWESTLLGRDINLHEVAATSDAAVYLYDTTLNVTWLRDANVNINNGNGGRMNWYSAMSWADNLVTGSGDTAISDWRLPAMTNVYAECPTGNQGTMCYLNTSEMSSLFISELGNPAKGLSPVNTGSFQNLRAGPYWLIDSGTFNTDIENPTGAWSSYNGSNGGLGKSNTNLYAMAVHDGDVAPVPEPETYAMLLAGLGLMGAVVRRRYSDKDKALAIKS